MKILTIIFLILTIAFSQSVQIKDSEDNILMEVEDQGTNGLLKIDKAQLSSTDFGAKISVEMPVISSTKGVVIKDGFLNSESRFEVQDNEGNIDFMVDAAGNMQVGTNGVLISEIHRITGTTPSNGNNYLSISYPTSYTMENTHILTYEVFRGNSNRWESMGTDDIYYFLGSDLIVIYFPTDTDYWGQPFRLILMKII